MNKRNSRVLALSILLIGIFEIDSVASAFPFQKTPQSFQEFFNQISWKDGNQRVFSDFASCKMYRSDPADNFGRSFDKATCEYGYMKIVSPMGTQVCKISAKYLKWVGDPESKRIVSINNPGNADGYTTLDKDKYCRWR